MKSSDCSSCPCCGCVADLKNEKSEKILSQSWHDKDDTIFMVAIVICRECGLRIRKSACKSDCNHSANEAQEKARSKAVEAWNRRV